MLARSLTRSALARSVAPKSAALPAAVFARQNTAPRSPAAPAPTKLVFGVRSFSTSMAARSAPVPNADNTKPAVDKVVQDIADYVHDYEITSPLAVSVPANARCIRVLTRKTVGDCPSLPDRHPRLRPRGIEL